MMFDDVFWSLVDFASAHKLKMMKRNHREAFGRVDCSSSCSQDGTEETESSESSDGSSDDESASASSDSSDGSRDSSSSTASTASTSDLVALAQEELILNW